MITNDVKNSIFFLDKIDANILGIIEINDKWANN